MRVLMLRDASQRIWAVEAAALAWRCDAPQHEGVGARRILAKPNRRERRPCEGGSSSTKLIRSVVSYLLIRGTYKLFDQGCDLSLYGAKCDIRLGHIDVADLPILNSVFPTTKSFTY